MILLAAILLVILLTLLLTVKLSHKPTKTEEDLQAFEQLIKNSSGIEKILLLAGRGFTNSSFADLAEESPSYRAIREKLIAAGGMYSGRVNVYVSVQIASLFIGAFILTATLFLHPSSLLLFAIIILSAAVMYWPWDNINRKAKKRAATIDRSLPEFAELLLMPIGSGYGILQALDFTAKRTSGPVSFEVQRMLEAISNRTSDESTAFRDCGSRLGTTSAKAFFNTLEQAYTDGIPAAPVIEGQTTQLRKINYENIREKLGKLPNSLVLIMALHLLPTLFLIILTPVFYTMGQI